MANCTSHKGIISTYIRVGQKSLLNKVGYYCSNCDIHYDLNQKPYTKIEKPYTVWGRWSSLVKIQPPTSGKMKDNGQMPVDAKTKTIIQNAKWAGSDLNQRPPSCQGSLLSKETTTISFGRSNSTTYLLVWPPIIFEQK